MTRNELEGTKMNPQKNHIKTTFHIFLALLLLMPSLVLIESISTAKAQSDTTLNFTITFEQPKLSQTTLNNQQFTQITMPDCISIAEPGKPALPTRTIRILFPQGTTTSKIHVSATKPQSIDYDVASQPIIPQQEPTVSGKKESKSFTMSHEVYASTTSIIKKSYSHENIETCRGFTVLSITLFPVEYIPNPGMVQYFAEMQITIDLEEQDTKTFEANNQMLRKTPEDLELIQSMVINPGAVNTYNPSALNAFSSTGLCSSDDTYEYVVITTQALNNDTSENYAWADLLAHRTSFSGLTTNLVTVEEIDQCSAYFNDTALFNDTAAHIREFIKDAYQNWETEYIILGGDWDTSNPDKQIIPERTFFVDDASHLSYPDMPCDLYYSNLDGDWRDTVNNLWGGGKNSGVNDHLSEVYVGRMTVSTTEEVSNFINKIIWYDVSAPDDFINKAAFFGGNLGWGITSKDYMDEIRSGDDPYFYECIGFSEYNNDHSSYEFDISQRIYHDIGNSIPGDYQNVINNNNACIINHLSHGTATTALDMSNGQLSALTNTHFFFAFSAQCLSGRFTAGDTTEKILTSDSKNNGAFGLIWNTGYGWGSSTDTNGPNQFLQRQFWDYILNNSVSNWSIGKAFYYAKDMITEYVDTSWHYSWCYNWYSTHLFGDPAQKLRIASSDESINVSNASPTNEATGLTAGEIQLCVNVTDPENDTMDVFFLTNASGTWESIGSNLSQNSGMCTQTHSFSDNQPKLWWRVNTHDISGSSGWTNTTYNFPLLLYNITPEDESINQSINISQLSFYLNAQNNETYNWTIQTNPPVGNNSGFNDTAGNKNCTLSNLSYNTTYIWYVNVSLYGDNSTTCIEYNFTIESEPIIIPDPVNIAPNISVISPLNESSGVSISTSQLLFNISDFENNTMNWTVSTNPDIGQNIGVNDSSGDKYCNISGLSYSTTYNWYVQVSDGANWTNHSFWFTTESQPSSGGGGSPRPRYTPAPAPPANNVPDTPETPNGTITGYVNTTYNFTTSTFDSDGDMVKFKFSWGDETEEEWSELVESGAEIVVSHSWDAVGIFNVTVISMDEQGDESSRSDSIIISITLPPEPPAPDPTPEEIDYTPGSSSEEDDVYTFNASEIFDLNETEDSYFIWDFGDGTITTELEPDHSFVEPGLYNVTLTVFNNEGDKTNILTFQVHVQPQAEIHNVDDVNDDFEGIHPALGFNPLLIFTVAFAFLTFLLILLIWKKYEN